jgi:Leucine-rich repeat (LRR) protein
LQGKLDGAYFSSLAKLTHLEIESNFLAGELPSQLLQHPEIVYVYIRNNNLDLHLPTVLGNGTWPSLFAAWLDSNNVTGPIPATIADKVTLASFSITNTTLRGSIPTEMGLLTDMRRLWLYNNELTGVVPDELANLAQLEVFEVHGNPDLSGRMPQGVCDVIQEAKYQFKSLTASCSSLNCDSCCTECY